MMMNRLLGMVYTLMNKEVVTADEFAKRYEVSVRTVYRDVETLSMAGIPVYTRKGKNGGISLVQSFVLDKMLVTQKEQEGILAALAGMQETGAQDEQEMLHKLGDFFKTEPLNWVSIDLSDWSGCRQRLFADLKKAVLGRRLVVFDYYGQYGEMSSRTVEPYQLLFKDYTWYLRAFCRTRNAVRTFKIMRMKRVQVLDETFEPDGQWQDTKAESRGEYWDTEEPLTDIELLVDQKEAYRIYDQYEEEQIEVTDSGDFLIHMRCLADDWIYGRILSFGPSAKVLSPEHVAKEVRKRIRKMQERYEDS